MISLKDRCGTCIHFKSDDGVNGMCKRPKVIENGWRAYKVRTSVKCKTYKYNGKEFEVESLKPKKKVKPDYKKALDKACYELMKFAECDRCPMKDDHCMITNWQCKDKWKEWCLKDE